MRYIARIRPLTSAFSNVWSWWTLPTVATESERRRVNGLTSASSHMPSKLNASSTQMFSYWLSRQNVAKLTRMPIQNNDRHVSTQLNNTVLTMRKITNLRCVLHAAVQQATEVKFNGVRTGNHAGPSSRFDYSLYTVRQAVRSSILVYFSWIWVQNYKITSNVSCFNDVAGPLPPDVIHQVAEFTVSSRSHDVLKEVVVYRTNPLKIKALESCLKGSSS